MKKNIFDTSLSTTIKLSLRRTLVLQQSLQQLLQQPAQSEAKGYVILFSRPHPLIPLQKRGTVRHCKSKLNNYHINLSLLPVSYTHLRAHETGRNLVCRLLLEKKK